MRTRLTLRMDLCKEGARPPFMQQLMLPVPLSRSRDSRLALTWSHELRGQFDHLTLDSFRAVNMFREAVSHLHQRRMVLPELLPCPGGRCNLCFELLSAK